MSTIIVFNSLGQERRLSLTVNEPLDHVENALRSGWANLSIATGPVLVNAVNVAFVQEATKPAVPLTQGVPS